MKEIRQYTSFFPIAPIHHHCRTENTVPVFHFQLPTVRFYRLLHGVQPQTVETMVALCCGIPPAPVPLTNLAGIAY